MSLVKNWSTVNPEHADLLKSKGYSAEEQKVEQTTLDDLISEFTEKKQRV